MLIHINKENKIEAEFIFDIACRMNEKERSYWQHFLRGVRYDLELAEMNKDEDTDEDDK